MDDARARRISTVALVASLAVVALLSLTPEGSGWSWGSPGAELRWYLTGLHSTATVVQLTGNLGLLTVPAALAVLRRPALGRVPLLAAVALAAGTGIELLQWAPPSAASSPRWTPSWTRPAPSWPASRSRSCAGYPPEPVPVRGPGSLAGDDRTRAQPDTPHPGVSRGHR